MRVRIYQIVLSVSRRRNDINQRGLVAIGLEVFNKTIEDEVREIVDSKGKHNPDRTTNRHGFEKDVHVVLVGDVWKQTYANVAIEILNGLAKQLETLYPGAVTSLRQGLNDTLSTIKFDMPDFLKKTLSPTNRIKFFSNKNTAKNVKCWERYAGFEVACSRIVDSENKFCTIREYKQLPYLMAVLQKGLALNQRLGMNGVASA